MTPGWFEVALKVDDIDVTLDTEIDADALPIVVEFVGDAGGGSLHIAVPAASARVADYGGRMSLIISTKRQEP